MKRQRRRYFFAVLDATVRAADAIYELGEVTATSAERAEGIIRRRYLAECESTTAEDFDDQIVIEAREAA